MLLAAHLSAPTLRAGTIACAPRRSNILRLLALQASGRECGWGRNLRGGTLPRILLGVPHLLGRIEHLLNCRHLRLLLGTRREALVLPEWHLLATRTQAWVS